MNRIILTVTLVLFGALTAVALWVDGVFGIFASIFHSYGSMQIYADLIIALTLVVVWIYRDANKAGRNPWPWIIATFVVGTFSPLIYLLVRESSAQ